MQQVQALDATMIWDELSLVLMDDRGIAHVHEAHLGSPRPTDVISFAYPPSPGDSGGHTGEVIVNVERAARVGPRYQGVTKELALYIAHGCHHLTGAEDHTPELRTRMRRIERGWLKAAAAAGLIESLTVQPD